MAEQVAKRRRWRYDPHTDKPIPTPKPRNYNPPRSSDDNRVKIEGARRRDLHRRSERDQRGAGGSEHLRVPDGQRRTGRGLVCEFRFYDDALPAEASCIGSCVIDAGRIGADRSCIVNLHCRVDPGATKRSGGSGRRGKSRVWYVSSIQFAEQG